MRQGVGLLCIMGGKENGNAMVSVQLGEHSQNNFLISHIHIGGWLIAEQYLRLDGQGASQGQPLGFATGKLSGRAMAVLAQANGLQYRIDQARAFIFWSFSDFQAKFNVFGHCG